MIFSRSALRKLGPHLDECLDTVVVSYNEDVEVGRCVSRMLKLQCTWSWEVLTRMLLLYYVLVPITIETAAVYLVLGGSGQSATSLLSIGTHHHSNRFFNP